jgi:hypothetical protein
VKDFFVHRTARGLTVAIVALICVLLAAAGPAQASKNAPVEVGFIGVTPKDPVTGRPLFKSVLLNVQSVRINPMANAGPGSGQWQKIPVPPGIGGVGQRAELQIDLNASQNVPQLFNTANVRPASYKVAQLQLDPNNPGSVIPNCPLAPPVGATADGCINYPIQLNSGVVITTPISELAPKKGQLAPLVLQVSLAINQAPSTPGGAYLVTVSLTQITTSVLGTVTGSVKVNSGSGSTTGKVRKLAVTAEAIGTNTAIATAPITTGSSCPTPNPCFSLTLPAAGPPPPSTAPFGTLYDLAVAGGGDTYAAQRLPPLVPGQTITLSSDLTVTGNQTLGNITGMVTDNCVAGKAIAGATLQLLIPPASNPTANCFDLSSAGQCVAVATANTDNAGDFPLPGTITIPPQFQNVPPAPKANPNSAYAMEITAPGYDSMIVQTKPSMGAGKKGGGTCSTDGTTFGPCNIALNTGYISGTIPIIPPNPGQTTLVQVFAEDAGTNTIESALPMPVAVTNSNVSLCPGSTTSSCLSFTLNAPPSVPTFDLFATTIDLYQGATDPYPGHTIAVLSDVAGPAEPTTPGACSTATATFTDDQTIDCIGHGSIIGTVSDANLGTSVVLSKQDASGNFVQITNSQVQNQSTTVLPSTNSYAFCAPADTYWLQTVQLPTPESSVVPSVAPTPEPTGSPTISVTIPPAPDAGGPSPTPTPAIKCPTTCSNPDGSCPGICNPVIQPL